MAVKRLHLKDSSAKKYDCYFEVKEDETLEIFASRNGLKYLIDELTLLLNSKNSDHTHFFSPEWGGFEMSEGLYDEENEKICHVKIYKTDFSESG